MRVWALAKRILLQLKHDKRTLALTLLAPLLILTLLYFVFESAEDTVTIGIVNGSQAFREALYENNGVIVDCQDLEPLEKGQVAAVATVESGKLQVWMDGSDSTQAARAIKALEAASKGIQPVRKDRMADITYVYGAEDLSLFDNFASILTGFLVFFFVFLISGISFLKERTTGTLEKVLSTPIHRWEVVGGYVLGYGLVNLVQSAVITSYLIYVLGVFMVGAIWLVLLITLVTSIAALTLGILLSTAANSEFQMIQFIPLVIVPQAFFTGLFTLPNPLELVGRLMPLYYTADALKSVMMKDASFWDILPDIGLLAALSVIFMLVNTVLLKRYRRI